ncbi:hypothetical protein F9K33_01110 [bacterium]|nr:MAG: hypothetical protein F9K33_01110 [bacterium]
MLVHNRIFIAAIFSLIFATGCTSPMLTIYKENPLSKEVIIIAGNTENMTIGKTYIVYRNEIHTTLPSSGAHAGHGGHDMGGSTLSRKMVGLILITTILDSKTASAQVVSGDVQNGDIAEE